MRVKRLLRLWLMLSIAGAAPMAGAQPRPCSAVSAPDRDFARSFGLCQDAPPPVIGAPNATQAPSAVVAPVPNVIGLNFDAARSRLAGFSVQRAYRASNEPGGTVLEQQPAPPARVASGATIRLVLSDGALRSPPRVSAAEIDGVRGAPAGNAEARAQPSPGAVGEDSAPVARAREPNPAPPLAPAASEPASTAASLAESVRLTVPNVLGMTIESAQAKLGSFRLARSYRASDAPRGRVIEQFPAPSARASAGGVITLVVSGGPPHAREPAPSAATSDKPTSKPLEQPNAINSAAAEASSVPPEVESAATSPTAPAAEATMPTVPPAEAAAPITAPAPAASPVEATAPIAPPTAPAAAQSANAPVNPAPAPVQSAPFPLTLSSNAVFLLIASVLLLLALGALLMRRRHLSRQLPLAEEEAAPVQFVTPPTDAQASAVAAPNVTPPDIVFSARLEPGETTIELIAPDDESAPEYSREIHE